MSFLRRHRPRPAPEQVPGGSDYASYMTSAKHVARLRDELTEVAHAFLVAQGIAAPGTPRTRVRTAIDDFFALYPQRPVAENLGGSRFHNCFWLHLVARCLEPSLVVESGTWKGQTSWLLRAACPQAALHCFDVSFARLVYRDPSIHYHEADWGDFRFEVADTARSLCFFDDHVNQARRVREAHAKGFRRLLFDDNPPAHKLYSFGYPGVPTIAMLMDATLAPGEAFEWVWRGERRRYVYQETDAAGARPLIRRCAVFPDVASLTKYGHHAFLSYVELADR